MVATLGEASKTPLVYANIKANITVDTNIRSISIAIHLTNCSCFDNIILDVSSNNFDHSNIVPLRRFRFSKIDY